MGEVAQAGRGLPALPRHPGPRVRGRAGARDARARGLAAGRRTRRGCGHRGAAGAPRARRARPRRAPRSDAAASSACWRPRGASAASGRGGVALVQGPAGIGKTCLAAWMLARVAHDGGARGRGRGARRRRRPAPRGLERGRPRPRARRRSTARDVRLARRPGAPLPRGRARLGSRRRAGRGARRGARPARRGRRRGRSAGPRASGPCWWCWRTCTPPTPPRSASWRTSGAGSAICPRCCW